MFALWPMGRYRDILGQIHKILLKNHQILEKTCNDFIFTTILNPCESSYDKFFDVPHTVCVFFWSFWGKNRRFFMKICETFNSSFWNHQ
jgi:hypothetical protein